MTIYSSNVLRIVQKILSPHLPNVIHPQPEDETFSRAIADLMVSKAWDELEMNEEVYSGLDEDWVNQEEDLEN